MDGILICNRENHIVDCNQKFVSMWRIPPEIIAGGDEMTALKHVLDQVVDPDGLYKLVTRLYDNIEETGDLGEIHFKDGRVFERYSQPQRLGNEIVGRVWSFRDITARKKAEEILQLRERAIEASPNGIIISEVAKNDYLITYVNPAFERITGYKKEEVIGKNCRFLQGIDREQPAVRRIHLALEENKEVNVVLRNYRKDGSLFWNQLNIAPVISEDNTIRHFVGIVMDITNQKMLEDQLPHQATHDALTGLPNRSLLLDRIQQNITQLKHGNLLLAVLFLDLDQFKLVNDGLGHIIGDQLLAVVAERLQVSVEETATVARLGGDEFIIVLPKLEREEQAYQKAQQLLEALAKPISIEGKVLHITTSIGISFYPKDGKDVNALLRSADMSMYLAKEQGRNNFKAYTAELERLAIQRMNLENELRSALENKEFFLQYQPFIDVNTNTICGAEALIRWQHPELGLISPQEFIPISEEDGLIIPIGQWVLQTACAQLKKWQEAGFPKMMMAINLSGRQLQQPLLIPLINDLVRAAGIKHEQIELEITESTLLENTEEIIEKLDQLKALGLRLAIDDFGTGYSSLSYLKKFPVDKLKIDRSFIQDITTNENNAAISAAIIQLAHSLDLQVIAEGVETEEQLHFLQQHHCDEIQGYYFSKPVDADSFLGLLHRYNKIKETETIIE